MIPIGDQPNEPGTPVVTRLLVVANVAVFAVAWFTSRGAGGFDENAYSALVDRFGSVPAAPSVETTFTSMFMHGGLMHLLGNMLFLWIYGDNVEARLGHLGFLAAYLATGVAAALVDAAMRPNSAIPAVGASGAISGVLGMYLIGFPRNHVKVLVWIWWYAGVVLVPAWIVLAAYFFLQNLVPAIGGAESGIAYGAHLGGFLAGVVLFLVLLPAVRKARTVDGERSWRW